MLGNIFLLEVKKKLSYRKYQILQSELAEAPRLPEGLLQPTLVARRPGFEWLGKAACSGSPW